jgi:amidase
VDCSLKIEKPVMQRKGGRPVLRQLALASFILLTPPLVSAQAAEFRIEEATIEDIQAAILRGELTSTRVVQIYLNRIKAYNGTCVNQPDGVLGQGPITPIKNAHQLNALMTLNLRPAKRERLGFDGRKSRSMTAPVDDDPAMPDALEVAAQQDAYFASTGKLIGVLHGVVFSIKDQYDTFDMRTTAGMDAAYANDRPPRDATFVKRLREAGAIILAKANLGEMGTANSRSSFGGPFCNPYDTERSPGTSSGGSGSSVAANLVTCSIGEETGGSIHHPAKNNSLVGLAPTQELVSRAGMLAAGFNTRVGPLCRTVKDAARVLEVIAGYDPNDELTAFSVGRLPTEPYRSFANETTLNGMRIGVIREHMDKKVLNEADGEAIDLTERAIGDLVDWGRRSSIRERGARCFRAASTSIFRSIATGCSSNKIRISFRSIPTGNRPQTESLNSLTCFSIHPASRPVSRSATLDRRPITG